jgi:hypothetical protein
MCSHQFGPDEVFFFLKSVILITDLAALLATDGLMHFRMFYHPEQYF